MRKESTQTNRIEGLDILRGGLILLVIYGHTITPLPVDHLLKWMIYGFHMPAFFVLSGLVLSETRIVSLSPSQLFQRYKRLLVPWLFASVIWLVLFNRANLVGIKGTIRSFVYLFLYPDFHLWFVPALLLMIVLTWGFSRSNAGRLLLLLLALTQALAMPIIPWGNPHLVKVKFLLGDTRVYDFFIYFLVGFFFCNAYKPVITAQAWIKKASLLIFLLFAPLYIYSFYCPPLQHIALIPLGMNMALYSHFPDWSQKLKENSGMTKFLGWVGRNSFSIYLVHPFIMRPILKFPTIQQNEMFYGFLLWVIVVGVLYATSLFNVRKSNPGVLLQESGNKFPG